MLQEAIAKAEGGDGATKEEKELEELKQLLPEIREKVEDATESQRTASAASQAIQQALVSSCISRNSQNMTSASGFKALSLCPPQGGASTSSAFLCENGGPSSSSSSAPVSQVGQSCHLLFFFLSNQSSKGTWTPFQIPVKSSDSPPSKMASDISHLLRRKVSLKCLYLMSQFFFSSMRFNPLYSYLSSMNLFLFFLPGLPALIVGSCSFDCCQSACVALCSCGMCM